jgi:glycosyltransferase involved in cell wall biosynthesis
MKNSGLACYFYGDLPLWEKRAASSLMDWFGARLTVERFDVPYGRRLPQSVSKAPVWIVTRHWRKALAEARRFPGRQVYLSIFNLGNLHPSLPMLFLRKFRPAVPANVRILSHCALNYRFFREIEGLDEHQVSLLPLPCVGPLRQPPAVDRPFTVGMLDVFNREANLNYVMSVAHYLCQRDGSLRFKLIGAGRLSGHIKAMIRELGLGNQVQLVESAGGEAVSELDLLLYTPLRNDHFAPLLSAAAAHVPVLATEVPGIEDYITDGKDGYVLPLHEVRAMGELILRYQREPSLRLGFAESLSSSLGDRFSLDRVGSRWESVLSGTEVRVVQATAAA